MHKDINRSDRAHAERTPTVGRARWAAIGAAVAVSVGAGGFGLASATSPDGASAYVPITPCRLVDTRAATQVGPQDGPLGADTAITVEGWGDVVGDCNLPTQTTGLQLNVTAVGATQPTFLTLFPEGATRPTASNVNADSAAATPNSAAVTTNATNGKFHVYNRFGSVDVVIDVAGYYTDHNHDDRYYTKAEADAATGAAVQAALDEAPQISYMWVCDGFTDFDAVVSAETCEFFHSASGEVPTFTRFGIGQYLAKFPGVDLDGGHVQVTAYGDDVGVSCKTSSWASDTVSVYCFNENGVVDDERFTIQVTS